MSAGVPAERIDADIIAWALSHSDPAIRREAEAAVDKVRATVRIAELRAEIAQLRGRPPGGRPPGRPRASGVETCPDCGTTVSAGYLTQHRRRSALHTEAVAR